MIRAQHNDKQLVVDILMRSFDDNKSVNYIITQDSKRCRRIGELIEYSYDVCNLFGDIFLSDDKKGCVLLIKPDKKNTTLKSILLDLKFIVKCLGFSNIKKAMNRESKINQVKPDGLLYYLWFIGVKPENQGIGVGSRLLTEIIAEGQKQNRTLCLETSTLKNIPWYEKFGFRTYKELDFGYKLYCMKKV